MDVHIDFGASVLEMGSWPHHLYLCGLGQVLFLCVSFCIYHTCPMWVVIGLNELIL